MRDYVLSKEDIGRDREMKHLINRLYDPDYDFGPFTGDSSKEYMLATLPRSGSTYCAIRLWQSGVLGSPVEYLNFKIMGRVFRRLGYETDADDLIGADCSLQYWQDIKSVRTSPNGVFGFKMFATNYIELSRGYRDLLARITPNYVVYLTRKDVLSHAISYSKSQRSNVWFAGIRSDVVLEYDFEHIKMCVRQIEGQKLAWEKFFDHVNCTPIRIFYEDLLTSGSGVIDTVARGLGVNLNRSAELRIPLIQKQSDYTNQMWKERFHEDLIRSGESCSYA